jgi:hypothetical protein
MDLTARLIDDLFHYTSAVLGIYSFLTQGSIRLGPYKTIGLSGSTLWLHPVHRSCGLVHCQFGDCEDRERRRSKSANLPSASASCSIRSRRSLWIRSPCLLEAMKAKASDLANSVGVTPSRYATAAKTAYSSSVSRKRIDRVGDFPLGCLGMLTHFTGARSAILIATSTIADLSDHHGIKRSAHA